MDHGWKFSLQVSITASGVIVAVVFGVLTLRSGNQHSDHRGAAATDIASSKSQSSPAQNEGSASVTPLFATVRPTTAPANSTAAATFSVPLQTFTGYTKAVSVGGSLVTFHGAVAQNYDGYQFGPTTCSSISIRAGIDDADLRSGSGIVGIYTAGPMQRISVPPGRIVTATYSITGDGTFRLHSVLNYIYIDAMLTCSTPDGQ